MSLSIVATFVEILVSASYQVSSPCPTSVTGQNLADRMQVHKAKLKSIRKSRKQKLTGVLLAPEHEEQPEGMQI